MMYVIRGFHETDDMKELRLRLWNMEGQLTWFI